MGGVSMRRVKKLPAPVIHLFDTNIAPQRNQVVVTNCGERHVFTNAIDCDFMDRRLCGKCLAEYRVCEMARNFALLTFAFFGQKAMSENSDTHMLSSWEGEGGLCSK